MSDRKEGYIDRILRGKRGPVPVPPPFRVGVPQGAPYIADSLPAILNRGALTAPEKLVEAGAWRRMVPRAAAILGGGALGTGLGILGKGILSPYAGIADPTETAPPELDMEKPIAGTDMIPQTPAAPPAPETVIIPASKPAMKAPMAPAKKGPADAPKTLEDLKAISKKARDAASRIPDDGMEQRVDKRLMEREALRRR